MSKVAIGPRNLGIANEILTRCDKAAGTNYLKSRPEVPVDPEVAKLVLDQMIVEESGAQVLFGTVVTDVVKEKGMLQSVIISNINGEQAVRAKFFIDCTGDGQMAFLAGAECMTASGDQYASSPTLMFRIANCNLDPMFDYMDANPDLFALEYTTYRHHRMSVQQCRDSIANELYAHMADFVRLIKQRCAENPGLFTRQEQDVLLQRGILLLNQPYPNHVLINSTTLSNFRGTDGAELTSSMLSMRNQCHVIHRFLKLFVPGFENAYIIDTASIMGIRESRRILGDYVLTQDDIEGLRKFDDAICSNHGGVEIHSGKKNSLVLRELDQTDSYHVPYRAVIAKGFDNLFMAGRCFSATHPALSAARNIAYCCALGEACGTAAAQLVQDQKTNSRDVDIKRLQHGIAKNI